jgi:hypothetical protein
MSSTAERLNGQHAPDVTGAMPLPVSFDEVASEMLLQSDLIHAYLNRITGEVISINDEERRLVERGYDPDDVPEWQRDVLPKVQAVLESDDFLALPSQRDIHEYEIMERFCHSVENDDHRAQLLTPYGQGRLRAISPNQRTLGHTPRLVFLP